MRSLSICMAVVIALIGVSFPNPSQASEQVEQSKKASGKAVTIGTIIYDWQHVEDQMKMLSENGFTSCQMNYNEGMDEAFAKRLRKAADKYKIKITTVVGVPGHSEWNFRMGPSTIGLVPSEGREAKIATYHKMIDFCKMAGVPAMHSHFGFIPEDMSSDKYKDFINVMKPLAAYAKERGVCIYFETGQETPTTLIRAIKDIGYEGYANFDVMYGNDGKPRFLEVNARPGRNTYYVSLAGCPFVKPIVEHYVHHKETQDALRSKEALADRKFLFTMVPRHVAARETSGDLMEAVLTMYATDAWQNPLMNSDDCLTQRFWGLVNFEHMKAKFA